MKTAFALATFLTVLLGCQPRQDPFVPQSATGPAREVCPVSGAGNPHGTRWVPEANTFVDYTEDFFDWHYHGRDRDATPEETALHAVKELLRQAREDENVVLEYKLEQQLAALEKEFAPKLVELAANDEKRTRDKIKELSENNRDGQDTVTLSDNPEKK
jgi:hypothetical protein